ncbi:MAG: hypothetical protein F6K17_30480 [Okeania sp. SIO3C4]|nr:hypothetical protein [Okeania sp. SIO3C4]
MPFSNYKNIAAVAQEFQIKCVSANFINEIKFPVPNNFRKELEILLYHGTIYGSKYAICENLVYPILKEVWKSYYEKLTLWSHETLNYDEKLSRKIDYLL